MRTSTKLEIVVSTVIFIMVVGTIAYNQLEHWNYVDSFYFTGITLSTIGYGDFYPTTPVSKIFTVFFAFAGIGVLAASISIFAGAYFEKREKILGESIHRKFFNTIKGDPDKRRDIIEGTKDIDEK